MAVEFRVAVWRLVCTVPANWANCSGQTGNNVAPAPLVNEDDNDERSNTDDDDDD